MCAHAVLVTVLKPLVDLEYLVDGKIQGKDVAKSGCPQRWGITTIEELISA